MSRRRCQPKKNMDIMSKASNSRSIWSGLEHKKPEDRTRNLTSICQDKGTLEHFTAISSYLTGEYKGNAETLFLELLREVTKGSRHKLEHTKFPMNIRITSSTRKAVKYWTLRVYGSSIFGAVQNLTRHC